MLIRALLSAMLLTGLVSNGLAGERKKVLIDSSADGSQQPCYVILPNDFDPHGETVPLLVSLHTWSGDVEQRNLPLEELVEQRGWIYLFPHFRGPNKHPDACGSEKAHQDILDAVTWARNNYPVDGRRVYLTGESGGGHMTMLMVGRHPEIWAAASAWAGISDLTDWYRSHAEDRYGEMMRQSCGGAPGDGGAVDSEYIQRSPLTHLARGACVPLAIAAGIHDGHQGSVPIRHSLRAFNVIARENGERVITPEEVAQLSRPNGRLNDPLPSDQVEDPFFGRKIYLRRCAGKSQVTIFEGGHEGIAQATVEWLARHEKPPAKQ